MAQSFPKFNKVIKPLLLPFIPRLHFTKKIATPPVEEINFNGKSILKAKDLSTAEIKSLLWTAYDLKLSKKHSHEVDHIKLAKITLLMHTPSQEMQASVYSAAKFLQTHINIIIDPQWDKAQFVNDAGSFLSTCSDLILCQSQYQSKVEKLAAGSSISVVCLQSCSYSIPVTLADMLAIQSHYGYLRGLNVGWVGKPCPLINTYLCIAVRLGLNIQYCCPGKSGLLMCPATLPLAKELSERKHTLLKECENPHSILDNADVIVLGSHDVDGYTITLDDIVKRSKKDWSLLHTLPRGPIEVTQEVFEHKNSLVWKAKGNLQWIYAALMIRLLSNYQHIHKMPQFDRST